MLVSQQQVEFLSGDLCFLQISIPTFRSAVNRSGDPSPRPTGPRLSVRFTPGGRRIESHWFRISWLHFRK